MLRGPAREIIRRADGLPKHRGRNGDKRQAGSPSAISSSLKLPPPSFTRDDGLAQVCGGSGGYRKPRPVEKAWKGTCATQGHKHTHARTKSSAASPQRKRLSTAETRPNSWLPPPHPAHAHVRMRGAVCPSRNNYAVCPPLCCCCCCSSAATTEGMLEEARQQQMR